MSYFVLAAVWFVSFHPFPAFIIGSTFLCLFIHKTINNMKMTILTSLLLLITVVSCNTTDPTPPDETKPTLTLALDDTSCTEVWLQLQTKDLALPAELTLKRYNPTAILSLKSLYSILRTRYSTLILSYQTKHINLKL